MVAMPMQILPYHPLHHQQISISNQDDRMQLKHSFLSKLKCYCHLLVLSEILKEWLEFSFQEIGSPYSTLEQLSEVEAPGGQKELCLPPETDGS